MTEYRECVQCGVESHTGEDICDACFSLDDGDLASHIGHALYQTKDMRKLQGCSQVIQPAVHQSQPFMAVDLSRVMFPTMGFMVDVLAMHEECTGTRPSKFILTERQMQMLIRERDRAGFATVNANPAPCSAYMGIPIEIVPEREAEYSGLPPVLRAVSRANIEHHGLETVVVWR